MKFFINCKNCKNFHRYFGCIIRKTLSLLLSFSLFLFLSLSYSEMKRNGGVVTIAVLVIISVLKQYWELLCESYRFKFILQNNARIIGYCGGYCGQCSPDKYKGLVIEVDQKQKPSIGVG